MTTPGIPAPDGAFVVGGKFGSDLNKETTQQQLAAGTIAAYTRTQNAVGSQVREPIVLAKGAADVALTQAQAAINTAADASEKADVAYALSTEWSLEFVAAAAEVLRGPNELLVGPMLNVRAGRLAILTDVHIAFLEQYGGLIVETRKWNATNTAFTTVHTGVIDPNVTRRNFSALSVPVLDEERFFPYVTSITGTVPPTVLQICVAGVYIDA